MDLKFNGWTNHFNFFRYCLVFVLNELNHLRISSDIPKNLFPAQDQCDSLTLDIKIRRSRFCTFRWKFKWKKKKKVNDTNYPKPITIYQKNSHRFSFIIYEKENQFESLHLFVEFIGLMALNWVSNISFNAALFFKTISVI